MQLRRAIPLLLFLVNHLRQRSAAWFLHAGLIRSKADFRQIAAAAIAQNDLQTYLRMIRHPTARAIVFAQEFAIAALFCVCAAAFVPAGFAARALYNGASPFEGMRRRPAAPKQTMTILILGLILFLGVHSTRIVADGWRTAQMQRLGAGAWKGIYSLLSLAGFGLIVWGFGLARQEPVVLWIPPVAMRHVAALLTLIAFVFLVAAYVPRNSIKSRLHHPMLLGVKTWAFAHLLANGRLADVVLFGAFLAWAIVCYAAAKRRDRAAGTKYPAGSGGATAATLAAGIAGWALFAFWLHGLLIGVYPFG